MAIIISSRKTVGILPLLLVLIWWQYAFAMDLNYTPCGEETNTHISDCPHGGYIVNPDQSRCKDRYYCFRRPGEHCDDEKNKCAPGLICKCRICQNCDDNECKMKLCPWENYWVQQFIKRLQRVNSAV